MQAELREFTAAAEKLYAKRFKVKSRSGSPPTLVFSGKGVTSLRTRVDAWKPSAIMDYLAARLTPASAGAGEL